MKSTIVTSITLVIAVLYCRSEFLAAPPAAVQPADEKWAVASESVSLGEGDYRLVTRDRSKLILEHVAQGKVTHWEIDIHDERPAFGQPQESWSDDIREIALSRWSRRNLLAVVRLDDQADSTFWCLSISNVKETTAKQLRLTAPAGVIAKGSKDDRILVLSGNRQLNSITAVMGKWSETQPGAVESGSIFFYGCPTQGVMGGRTGKFKTEYSPAAFDTSDKIEDGNGK